MPDRYFDERDYPFDPNLHPKLDGPMLRGLEKLRLLEDRRIAAMVYERMTASRKPYQGDAKSAAAGDMPWQEVL